MGSSTCVAAIAHFVAEGGLSSPLFLSPDIRIIEGAELLSLYQFNTKTAKHFFCKVCGIYTHHQRRSNPTQYGFNVACLDGINPLKISGVPTYDGVNHPADRK